MKFSLALYVNGMRHALLTVSRVHPRKIWGQTLGIMTCNGRFPTMKEVWNLARLEPHPLQIRHELHTWMANYLFCGGQEVGNLLRSLYQKKLILVIELHSFHDSNPTTLIVFQFIWLRHAAARCRDNEPWTFTFSRSHCFQTTTYLGVNFEIPD